MARPPLDTELVVPVSVAGWVADFSMLEAGGRGEVSSSRRVVRAGFVRAYRQLGPLAERKVLDFGLEFTKWDKDQNDWNWPLNLVG